MKVHFLTGQSLFQIGILEEIEIENTHKEGMGVK